jgi:hypothetical protein
VPDAEPISAVPPPASPRSPLQKGDVLTVKLKFPAGHSRRIAYRKKALVSRARDEAANELGLPRERIDLFFNGALLTDTTVLNDLQIPSTRRIIVKFRD